MGLKSSGGVEHAKSGSGSKAREGALENGLGLQKLQDRGGRRN